MLVVAAMLSILAMAVLPVAEVASVRVKERELRQALLEIRAAIDAYKKVSDASVVSGARAGSGYPADLKTLVAGVADPRPGSRGTTLYFLRRIPRDPFAPDTVPAELTWGLRSYDSPPDAPKAGADVYDVYSLAKRLGSNGLPLGQW
jgi:general secretion pathway protein G